MADQLPTTKIHIGNTVRQVSDDGSMGNAQVIAIEMDVGD